MTSQCEEYSLPRRHVPGCHRPETARQASPALPGRNSGPAHHKLQCERVSACRTRHRSWQILLQALQCVVNSFGCHQVFITFAVQVAQTGLKK